MSDPITDILDFAALQNPRSAEYVTPPATIDMICRAFRVPPWLMSDRPKPRRFSLEWLRWWWRTR